MTDLDDILSKVRDAPWPKLAGQVGDFALYETLLVGFADSVAKYSRPSDLPEPDASTASFVSDLRSRPQLTADEAEFLAYFDQLAELRDTLAKRR